MQVEFPVLRVPRRSPLAEVMQHLAFSADHDAETTASVHAQSEIPPRTVSHCIWVKYVIPTYGTVNMGEHIHEVVPNSWSAFWKADILVRSEETSSGF